MFELVYEVVKSIINLFGGIGYVGIFIGMAIESSFFPFPSELIMIPAGMMVASGKLLFFWVLILGVLGSVFGALINYFLALTLGRKAIDALVKKYGKVLFLSKNGIEKSERYFKKHGEIATFTGRLIPGVRQIISLPAGFSKMNLKKFVFFTALGAGIWMIILIYIGIFIGNNNEWMLANKGILSLITTLFAMIVLILYVLANRKKKIAES